MYMCVLMCYHYPTLVPVQAARATLLEGMILGYVSNLSNHVTQKSSHAALVALKQRCVLPVGISCHGEVHC